MEPKKKGMITIIGAGAAAAVFLFYINSAPVRIYDQPESEIESEQENVTTTPDSSIDGYNIARTEWRALLYHRAVPADGYGIVSAGPEPTGEDALWKVEYLRYMEHFEYWINDQIADWVSKGRGRDAPTEADIREGIKYDLIYIDDDDIPELYVEYAKFRGDVFDGLEAHIITYYDGQLIDNRMEDSDGDWTWYCDHIDCEYIERSGLCYGSFSALENFGYDIYKLENGRLQTIGSGNVFWDFSAFTWNDVVYSTPEEMWSKIDEVYDSSRSIKCGKKMSAVELMGLIDSL